MLQFFLCDTFPKNENFLFPFLFALLSLPALYRVYQEILNRFEIALNFAKQLLVSSFLYNIASLKTFLELKFCKPGGGGGGGGVVFSDKLKMACARNLKALIVF
jgi:hypothetical protein